MWSRKYFMAAALAAVLVWVTACSEKAPTTSAANIEDTEKSLGQKLRDAVSSEVEIPSGTELQARLVQAVGSARSTAGEKFEATLHTPVVVGKDVVLPKGTQVTGHVTRAVPSGHLKTPARLALTLDSIEWKGESYPVSTTTFARSAKSHKKRNIALIGGGSGAGALIGAVAGGGTGALIGAGAGAAAGTAGAYATGKKDIVLPSETLLTFKLQAPVKVKKS